MNQVLWNIRFIIFQCKFSSTNIYENTVFRIDVFRIIDVFYIHCTTMQNERINLVHQLNFTVAAIGNISQNKNFLNRLNFLYKNRKKLKSFK